jgi:hypothetical protein
LTILAIVDAQSTSEFAAGEAQRVYDLLADLGCLGNPSCFELSDFQTTSRCDYRTSVLKCDATGRLAFLYDTTMLFSDYQSLNRIVFVVN